MVIALKWLSIFYIFLSLVDAENWCKISQWCKRNNESHKHILCEEKDGREKIKACEIKVSALPKDEMLSLHNKFRQDVSKAAKKRHGLPKARPIGDLKWDDYLAQTADVVGKSCLARVNYCLRNSEFKEVGQSYDNLTTTHDSNGKDETQQLIEDMKSMVEGWLQLFAKEKDAADIVQKYRDGPWGKGTQILWAKTQKLGCAGFKLVFKSSAQLTWRHMMICHYGPEGNTAGEKVYETDPSPDIEDATEEDTSDSTDATTSRHINTTSRHTDTTSPYSTVDGQTTELSSLKSSAASPSQDSTTGIIDDFPPVDENKTLPLQTPTVVPVVTVISSTASPTYVIAPNNFHFLSYILFNLFLAMLSLPTLNVHQ